MTALRDHPSGPPARSVRPAPGGVGRTGSVAAERVSDDLRRGASPFLARRRQVGALHWASVAALTVVGLYQGGALRRVPEPPLRGLDADAVAAGGPAYAWGRTPDSALGVASAGVTLALVGMGPEDRAQRHPLIPLAAGAKVVLDALAGVYLLAEQATRQRRFCSWCTVAALTHLAAAPLVVPETRAAWRALRGRRVGAAPAGVGDRA